MAEQDCRKCKDWRTCIGKEGYLFAHLRFCPFQVVWVLANDDFLDKGQWPPQYSVYEEPRKERVAEEGYFVKPKLIIAEVRVRLETTGTPGKLLVAQCKIAGTLDEIDDEAWEVLMYAKGWNRKDLSFRAWKRQRKYRQMIIKK